VIVATSARRASSTRSDEARLRRVFAELGPEIAEVAGGEDAGVALEALQRYIAATYQRLKSEQIAEMVESAAGPEAQGRVAGRAEMLLTLLGARCGKVPPRCAPGSRPRTTRSGRRPPPGRRCSPFAARLRLTGARRADRLEAGARGTPARSDGTGGSDLSASRARTGWNEAPRLW
jgi:hypothetical protein